ncbi:MAG: class I SAM-dependent methyltransferase [Candidatus Paceibacterota bacterium]
MNQVSNEITSKEYWQQTGVLNSQERDVPPPIATLFKKILKKNEYDGAIALEIGCAPGTFLAYICKEFNYQPEGVDYANGASEITNHTLRKAGLPRAIIHEEDFFTWKPSRQYDLVSSFGFVEHFHDLSIGVNKHVDLLKNGGTLVLEVPNFTNGQYVLHNWLDRDNLVRCNLKAMHISFLEDIVKQHNLDVKYLGYVGGIFDFWWENEHPNIFQKLAKLLLKPIAYIGRRIPIQNRLFSPFIVLIAEKQ